jgi:D-3-phosphoglycerate dehydrogenase/C-terminal binding protein
MGLAKRGLVGSLAPMFKVVITDYVSPPVEPEETIFAGLAKVECLNARSVAELDGRVEDADAIIIFHEVSLPAGVIDRLEKCRVIVRGGVGYDAVDFRRAAERGIPVCNVPDYGVDEVADQAIGMMIACSRGFLRVERELKQTLEPWNCRIVEPVPRLAGATLGIVGLGRIGQATAQRAKAMRMRVIAHDPYLRPGIEKVLGVEMVDFRELLETSDAVSLHVPLTDETRHMINTDALGRMKPGAILVNTARGAVVDTAALAVALRQGKIAGAGVDVLPTEPARADEPLIQVWREANETKINLILTPHTAFYSVEGLLEMRTKAAQEIVRALRGGKLVNCVNAQWLPEEMRERVLIGTPPTV